MSSCPARSTACGGCPIDATVAAARKCQRRGWGPCRCKKPGPHRPFLPDHPTGSPLARAPDGRQGNLITHTSAIKPRPTFSFSPTRPLTRTLMTGPRKWLSGPGEHARFPSRPPSLRTGGQPSPMRTGREAQNGTHPATAPTVRTVPVRTEPAAHAVPVRMSGAPSDPASGQ